MTLIDDLRIFLMNDATVSSYITPNVLGGIAENRVNQVAPDTNIAYFLAGKETEYDLSGQSIFTTTKIDLEVHSSDIQATNDLADYIRTKLNGYYGLFYVKFNTVSSPITAGLYTLYSGNAGNDTAVFFCSATNLYLFYAAGQWILNSTNGTTAGLVAQTSGGNITNSYGIAGTPTMSYWCRQIMVEDSDESYQLQGNFGDECINIMTMKLTVLGA